MAMSENTIRVIKYLQENDGVDLTAQDVADALGLPKRTVDGCFTSGIAKAGKDLGKRVPAEIEYEDEHGNLKHKEVKFLKLTPLGLGWRETDAE